ncbi:hypothetical protein ACX12L_06845 [Alicycliphilus sp. T452]
MGFYISAAVSTISVGFRECMQLTEPESLEHLKEKSPIWYALSTAGSYLVGDFFTASYYKESLSMAAAMLPLHRPMLEAEHKRRQSIDSAVLERAVNRAEETSRWARKMEGEGYHTMFSHVFLSLWAVQEAGVENLIAAMVRHNRQAAEVAISKLKPGKVGGIESRPWPEQMCREAAGSLEKLAINQTPKGGLDAMGRMKTLFGWFDVQIDVSQEHAQAFNEANGVRNLLLHQYGHVTQKDVQQHPGLAEFEGRRLSMSGERLHRYHDGIVALFQQLILNLPKSPCSKTS